MPSTYIEKSFGKGFFKNIVEFTKQGILRSDEVRVASVHLPFNLSYINSSVVIQSIIPYVILVKTK